MTGPMCQEEKRGGEGRRRKGRRCCSLWGTMARKGVPRAPMPPWGDRGCGGGEGTEKEGEGGEQKARPEKHKMHTHTCMRMMDAMQYTSHKHTEDPESAWKRAVPDSPPP